MGPGLRDEGSRVSVTAEFLSLRKSARPESGPVGKESDPETWDGSILVDALETLKPETCLRALCRRKWPMSLLPPCFRMAQTHVSLIIYPRHYFGPTLPSQGGSLECGPNGPVGESEEGELIDAEARSQRQHLTMARVPGCGSNMFMVGIWSLAKAVACIMWHFNANIAEINYEKQIKGSER